MRRGIVILLACVMCSCTATKMRDSGPYYRGPLIDENGKPIPRPSY